MASRTKPKQEESLYSLIVGVIIPAVLIMLVIRTLLFQPVNIPSGSMKNTLLVGDFLLISKFSYGYSHFSIPLSPPLFSGRIFGSKPNRGDIIVFRHPTEAGEDLIKRLIGLPGERIQVLGGVVHINDVPVKREQLPNYVGEDPCLSGPSYGATRSVKRWRETLPNGLSYETLNCDESQRFPNYTDPYTVPADHYFFMGDNRGNSQDSRFPSPGMVPFENLIGRAQVVFFSVKEGERAWQVWRWPWSVRWGRLGTIVR
jgi:signal peptidase I